MINHYRTNILTVLLMAFTIMAAPFYLRSATAADLSVSSKKLIPHNEDQKRINELQEELYRVKNDLHQNNIEAFNRSSDAANRLISWMGVIATIYGIIIALASLFVGYVSIRNKQRSEEALATLEGAKSYVNQKIGEFEDAVKQKSDEMSRKLNEVIQMSVDQLAHDTASATEKVKQFGEQGISPEANQKIELIERKIKIFEDIGLPDDPKVLYSKAVVYADKNENEAALDLLRKSIQHDNNYADAYFRIGYIQNKLKHHNESIEAYDKVISIQPKASAAWNNRGVSLKEMNKYQEALDSYNKAIEINPDYALAYKNKIGILENIVGDNTNEYIKCYDSLIRLEPNETAHPLNAGRLFNKLGQPENASKYYKIYLDKYKMKIAGPEAGEVDHLCYYEALIIDEKYAEATSYQTTLEAVINSENRKITYAILHSFLLFSQGDDSQAKQVIRDTVNLIRSSSYTDLSWNFDDINPYLKARLDDNKYQRILSLENAAKKSAPLDSIRMD